MTEDKALTHDAHAPMTETGEAFTTSCLDRLDHRPAYPDATAPDDGDNPSLPPSVADPGMSDEAIQRGTGKTWAEWLRVLDAWGARDRTHREIARYVAEEFGVGAWWAQGVTVGYERARGMRKKHERPDGYSVNASRTLPLPVARVYAAFADDAERATWLEPELVRVRTFTENKVWRCEMLGDGSRVEVRFTAKTPHKTSIAIQQTRLASEDAVAKWRAFWKSRLDRLADLLA